MTPATITAIELAWYSDLSAVKIAQIYRLSSKYVVYDIWAIARAADRLPVERRDEWRAIFERLFTSLYESQSSIPPFTPTHKAPVDALKGRAA